MANEALRELKDATEQFKSTIDSLAEIEKISRDASNSSAIIKESSDEIRKLISNFEIVMNNSAESTINASNEIPKAVKLATENIESYRDEMLSIAQKSADMIQGSALEIPKETKKATDKIIEVSSPLVDAVKALSNDVQEATNSEKNLESSLTRDIKALTKQIKDYTEDVQKSIDELRQLQSRNAREIRENIKEVKDDIDGKINTIIEAQDKSRKEYEKFSIFTKVGCIAAVIAAIAIVISIFIK